MPHVVTSGLPLEAVGEVRSEEGVLNVTLVIDALEVKEKFWFKTRAYNGSLPGPTLRVRPGDTLRFTIINALKDVGDVGVMNTFHNLNVTNVHLHGIHVSPKQDDILVEIWPDSTETYTYEIPRNHAPGLFWYHAHCHGSVAFQVAGGLEGSLIVDEEKGDVPEAIGRFKTIDLNVMSMPFAALLENKMWSVEFLSQLLLGHNVSDYAGSTAGVYGNDVFTNNFPHRDLGTFFLVNGHLRPVIDIQQGEWTRIRLIYGSASNALILKTACETQLIAKDGIYISGIIPRPFDEAWLPPGGRVDFLLKCETRGLVPWTITNNLGSHNLPFDPILLTWNVQPGGDVLKLPRWRVKRPCYLRDLRNATINDHRDVALKDAEYKRESRRYNAAHGRPGLTTSAGSFRINGRLFDPSRPLFDVALNTVVEFNFSIISQHPVHTHVNPLQFIGDDNPYIRDGDWHDTLWLPTEYSAIARMNIIDFNGMLFLHCHNLAHEDYGMLTWINVLPSNYTVSSPDDCWSPRTKKKPAPAYTLVDDAVRPPMMILWDHPLRRRLPPFAALAAGVLLLAAMSTTVVFSSKRHSNRRRHPGIVEVA